MANPSPRIVIGPVRVAFVNLMEPKRQQGDNGEEKDPVYTLTMLIDKNTPEGADQLAAIKKLTGATMTAKYGDQGNWPKRWTKPFHDADSGEDTVDGEPKGEKYAGFAGHYYAEVKSKFQPGVVTKKAGQTRPITDPEQVYAGMWCYVQLDAYAYDRQKKGVSLGLLNVLKVRDDERLGGGGPSAAEAFGDLDVNTTEADPFGDTGADANTDWE